jgi:allophanate hydrolase subunit 2
MDAPSSPAMRCRSADALPPRRPGRTRKSRRRVGANTRSYDILRILFSDGARLDPVLRAMTACTWTVSVASDRMGYRLEGPSLASAATADVLTMPTAIGSIQVPPSGQPILLMADRQTTGGYLQPAAVIAADIPVAAQLAPGDRLQFVACTFDEARAAFVERESPFAVEAC